MGKARKFKNPTDTAKKTGKIISLLKKAYPEAFCSLNHLDPYQLLMATILSAQCTDERVNKVTPPLFGKYPSPAKMAAAGIPELERLIKSTGFYHNKARALKESSRAITEKFGGKVPDNMEDLLSLKGVARKTANVVLGSAYGIAAGIVVDTHVKRLAFRMGLTTETDPEKVERDLMGAIDKKDWIWLSHALIAHGRKLCTARRPDCPACPLGGICQKKGLR